MYQDLYKFGYDRAKEQSESKKHIDGLSGKEEYEALQVCESEEDHEEPDDDTFETREDEPHEQYDNNGGYNS